MCDRISNEPYKSYQYHTTNQNYTDQQTKDYEEHHDPFISAQDALPLKLLCRLCLPPAANLANRLQGSDQNIHVHD